MGCKLTDNSHIKVCGTCFKTRTSSCAICDYGLRPTCPVCGGQVEQIVWGMGVTYACPNAWGRNPTCTSRTKDYNISETDKAVAEWNALANMGWLRLWVLRIRYLCARLYSYYQSRPGSHRKE